MSEINKHVDDFLDYYYSFNLPPEYAVLIKGAWGTGKSWFIQQTLDRLKENGGKCLYVSLYGVTTFEEIENSFFQQLHPVLSSKGMKLTSKIAKGLLKATIRVDFDGDGKPDANISAQVPDINIPDYLKNTDNFVLIFDDLERCSMKISDVLGYINHFVEYQGYKVVVVANEDEVIKNDDCEKIYLRIKEKLIGKTLEIKPDIKAALTHFIQNSDQEESKTFYLSNCDLILELYEHSCYKNLRNLKQSLWDFERLYKELPDSAINNEELLKELLKLYLSYSFEIKSGAFQAKELTGIKATMYSGLFDDEKIKKGKSLYSILSTKYPSTKFSDPIIDEGLWVDILDKGLISRDKIQESILNSRFYRSETTEAWVKLWHFHDLSDDDFDILVGEVKEEISEVKYKEVNIIKHIAGLLLILSDLGLISDTKKDIFEQFCSYIDGLKEQNELPVRTGQERHFIENNSFAGLGFFGKELQEFQDFCKYLEQKLIEVKVDSLPDTANDLLVLLEEDVKLFTLRLIHSNDQENIYYKTPILNHIPALDFVQAFLRLKPDDVLQVGYMFKERYRMDLFNTSLMGELDWLEEVKVLLLQRKEELVGKLSGYRIGLVINNDINEAIESLTPKQENG